MIDKNVTIECLAGLHHHLIINWLPPPMLIVLNATTAALNLLVQILKHGRILNNTLFWWNAGSRK